MLIRIEDLGGDDAIAELVSRAPHAPHHPPAYAMAPPTEQEQRAGPRADVQAIMALRGPQRVRIEGDLFHGRVPAGAVYVGRAAPGLRASKYANPYPARIYGQEHALQLYSEHLAAHPELAQAALSELAGRDLACWCRLDQPCHADVLLAASGLCAARAGRPDSVPPDEGAGYDRSSRPSRHTGGRARRDLIEGYGRGCA
jgi:hypothetical protein